MTTLRVLSISQKTLYQLLLTFHAFVLPLSYLLKLPLLPLHTNICDNERNLWWPALTLSHIDVGLGPSSSFPWHRRPADRNRSDG
jgi:hypothetical protein